MKTTPKPFVKWAGGKGNLLKTLELQLPEDFDRQINVTYIDPFVGGGAMLFHMLNNHSNITRAVINDVNKDLIRCYTLIKENPQFLIRELQRIEKCYYALHSDEAKKEYYLATRDYYNEICTEENERAAYFIFLNHTCFNGLYRVNSKGHFNVPFGRYKKPKICNEEVIMANHESLSKVDIYNADYSSVITHLGRGYNFVYLDPPYRSLLGSSNFKEYSSGGFGDDEQVELKLFCDRLTARGCQLMLSNSDSMNVDGTSFFEELYNGYFFGRILAPRYINAFAVKRQSQSEVLIKNYDNPREVLPIIPM